MKKLVLILSLVVISLGFTHRAVYAVGAGYRYIEGGSIINYTTVPLDVAKAVNFKDKTVTTYIPISYGTKNSEVDEVVLRSGKSSCTNVLGLVEVGDAGIVAAAKQGNIQKVHYVEYTKQRLYVPLGFIPIYFTRFETTVYGE